MRLNSIQFLRAMAVLLVVHTHSIDIQMMYSVSYQQNFFFLENFGAIGADLFFVISGFIISYVANKHNGIKAGNLFLRNRFLRINPVYYAASLITFLVFLMIYLPSPWEKTYRQLIDTITLIPLLKVQTTLNPVIILGWTLGFEWWFYLLFFLIIIIKVKNKVLGLFFIMLSLIIAGLIFHINDFRFVFFTNPIMLEFLFGVLIYWSYIHMNISSINSTLLLLCGILGYIYNIFYGYGKISELATILSGANSLNRALIWGIPNAFIVIGCVFLEKNGHLQKLWNNRLLLLIGGASYSIYLIHFIVLHLLAFTYVKIGFPFNPDVAIFLHIFLGITIGIIFYKEVELPLLAYLNLSNHPSLSKSKSAPSIPLAAAVKQNHDSL